MDNTKLSPFAQRIFKDLYLQQGETISDCFHRVSNVMGNNDVEKEIAFKLLKDNVWRVATPIFINAGTEHFMGSACWITGLEDSMDSIYETANIARKIFQHGAGIGIPIGNLREKDCGIFEGVGIDAPPSGRSSGPVSFMSLFDSVGATTKSGGRARRAAIMCVMPINHPDIEEFIGCKHVDGVLSNMNISVAITDDFMRAFKDNIPYNLISPKTKEVVKQVNARKLWDDIVDMAWKTADPGILFIDQINRFNVMKTLIHIQATNPCGEIPGLPYLACNLSHINLHSFCGVDGVYDFKKLYETSYKITVLMDNIIDKMIFPDDKFKDVVLKYRPLGIGFMGLSDALYEMNIPYDSKEGQLFASECMKTITMASVEASSDLAKDKGTFYNYDKVKNDVFDIIGGLINNDPNIMDKVKKQGLRNITHTTLAPTGTTAISADTSYGMEPSFGLVFQKTLVESGDTYTLVNPIFKKKYENETWYTSEMIEKIVQNGGSLKGIRGVPKEVKDVFVVAHDIKPKDRIDMQAVLQKHVSTAISSTTNLPSTATRDEVSELYRYAYQKGLKGITIYRDGSKKSQPITFSNKEKTEVKSNIDLPSRLQAFRHTVETGNGKMYINVSSFNGRPVEIFLTMGKSGQLFNTFCEGLGRTVSLALQHGVPAELIAKTLEGINSDRPNWYRFEETDKKPTQILSIPDAIAKVLERYYIGENKTEASIEGNGELCPKCGRYAVVKIEGCSTCTSCGESKCG